MIKLFYKVVKRVIFAILFLYALNLITSNINFIIPINLVTISIIVMLGFPGLGALVALSLLI